MSLFQTIAIEADKRRLPFLVIGGLAVNFYGFARDTGDLDLLIPRSVRAEWLSIFCGLNYRIVADRTAFLQLSPPKAGAWPVDLMTVNEKTFGPMHSQAVPANIYGARVLIPTLEHLIALKLHALKHSHLGRFLKDFMDVENLARIHRIDMKSEKIRQLFVKYGTVELYEKVAKACENK